MAHVVILGAGSGGLACAYALKLALGSKHEVSVVNANDYFQFVPSNPWAAVGWRQRKDITFPIDPYLSRKGIRFVHDVCTRIDAVGNALELESGGKLAYDYLVVATGPRFAFDEVPGSGPGGHTTSYCTIDQAERAWDQYQTCLAEPGPIVIGIAPNASCFAPAYEFAFVVNADLRRRNLRQHHSITFVTPEPYLGHFGLGGVGDSRRMLENEMQNQDINWITNTRITRAEKQELCCDELGMDGSIRKAHHLDFRFASVLPAFKGVAAVTSVEGFCNKRGFVLVDEYNRSQSYPKVYAVGTCIAIASNEMTPVPIETPKNGYMIESMVTSIVRNISAEIAGREPYQTTTCNALCLTDMGGTGAAFVALPHLPPRNVAWFKKGKWVHMAKIALEKYSIRKMKKGSPEPLYERYILKMMGIEKLPD